MYVNIDCTGGGFLTFPIETLSTWKGCVYEGRISNTEYRILADTRVFKYIFYCTGGSAAKRGKTMQKKDVHVILNSHVGLKKKHYIL